MNVRFQCHHSRKVTSFEVTETVDEYENTSTLVKWIDNRKASTALCYQLDVLLGDGTYAYVGVTGKTSFSVYDLPKNRITVFRIIETRPRISVRDSVISLIPPPEEVHKISAHQELQPENTFTESFSRTNYNIGAGAFGTSVTLVRNKKDHREYAAKIVKARTGEKRENVLREFNIMKELSHTRIIQLFGVYETHLSFIFVMEYCWGGDLFDRVAEDEYMAELDVVRYVRQICQGLVYLNCKGIWHLDIKPENIICTSPNSIKVKIIDFGVARSFIKDVPHAVYGTREYAAPEILDCNLISEYSDIWSVGVVTYVLLSGLLPFTGKNWYDHSIKIINAEYDYKDEAFEEVSDLAKDFVDKLLIRVPTNRLTAEKALRHRWLKEGPPKRDGPKYLTKMHKNLKKYLTIYKHFWKRVINVWNAAHRLLMIAHPKA